MLMSGKTEDKLWIRAREGLGTGYLGRPEERWQHEILRGTKHEQKPKILLSVSFVV